MQSLFQKWSWGYTTQTSTLQSVFRVFLGIMLFSAGISHLTFARQEFVAQVPMWVPLSTDLVVLLSGAVEIALGLSLIILPKWKAIVGWCTALFFILIFPGNIAQYLNATNAFGLDTDQSRFARLFFQPVLVAWALWSTAAIRAYMSRNRTGVV